MRLITGADRETGTQPWEAQPPPPGLESPGAATSGREHEGFLSRVWGRYSSALRRAVLGRSGWDYLKHYTGGDAYWDNMIAAQREREAPAGAQAHSRTPQPPEPPR
jgi:hypothetical protein